MFIGEREIELTLEQENDQVNIKFVDGGETTINKNLFNIIQSENSRVGSVVDVVNNVLATKILLEMAEYGLEYYMVDNIAVALQTLAHNLRNDKVSEKFGCKNMLEIKIKQLVEGYEKG